MTLYWLVGLCLVAALIMAIVGRIRTIAAPLTSATFLALAISLVTTTDIHDLVVLGRVFRLTNAGALAMGIAAFLMAIGSLGALYDDLGRSTFAVALVSMGLFLVALSAENYHLFALLVLVATVGAELTAVAERQRTAATGIPTLALATLAAVGILVAAWAIEEQARAPELHSDLWRTATLTGGLGLAILAGAPPFHVWQPPEVRRSGPLSTVLLTVVLNGVALLRLRQLLVSGALDTGGPIVAAALIVSGLLGIGLGSIGAWCQRTVAGILAYAAVAETGLVLLALGAGGQSAGALAMWHAALRGLGIVAMSMMVPVLRRAFGSDDVARFDGALRRAPLTIVVFALVAMMLAGLPPMASFFSRLGIARMLAQDSPRLGIAVQMAVTLPSWALARFMVAALRPVAGEAVRGEPLAPRLLPLAMALLSFALGLFPSLLRLLALPWDALGIPWPS